MIKKFIIFLIIFSLKINCDTNSVIVDGNGGVVIASSKTNVFGQTTTSVTTVTNNDEQKQREEAIKLLAEAFIGAIKVTGIIIYSTGKFGYGIIFNPKSTWKNLRKKHQDELIGCTIWSVAVLTALSYSLYQIYHNWDSVKEKFDNCFKKPNSNITTTQTPQYTYTNTEPSAPVKYDPETQPS